MFKCLYLKSKYGDPCLFYFKKLNIKSNMMEQNMKILTNLSIFLNTITCAKYAQMTQSGYIMTYISYTAKIFQTKIFLFLNLTMLAFYNNNLNFFNKHLIFVITHTFKLLPTSLLKCGYVKVSQPNFPLPKVEGEKIYVCV